MTMRLLSLCSVIVLAGALAMPAMAEDAAEPSSEFTPEQKLQFMKGFVASKFGIREYCKKNNPEQIKAIDEGWANYLAIESPEMKAYAGTPELAAKGAEAFNGYVDEASKSKMSADGLNKYCAAVIEFRKF